MQTIKFRLQGLTCEACVKLSTIKIKNLIGESVVKIDLESGRAEVSSDRDISLDKIRLALAGTAYEVSG
jgi:copper chaperone CopZ